MRGIGILALINSLQQKLILNFFFENLSLCFRNQTWNGIYYSFYFSKRNIVFLGNKQLENKTSLYYYGKKNKPNSWREEE